MFGAGTVRGAAAERHSVLVFPSPRRRAGRYSRAAASIRPAMIGQKIPAERVIGCVVYPARRNSSRRASCSTIEGNRFPVGEPDGSNSETRRASVAMPYRIRLAGAGAERHSCGDLGSSSGAICPFNPISALSRATLASICQYSPTRELAVAMMTEGTRPSPIKLGIKFRVPLEKRGRGRRTRGSPQDLHAARMSRPAARWRSTPCSAR